MPSLKPILLGSCFVFLCAPSLSQAEIYRWVDDKGKVNYSDNKNEAGKHPITQVTSKPALPAAANAQAPDANYWAEQEGELKRRQMEREEQEKKEAAARRQAARPVSLSDGKYGDTDAEKCNFAKDVLNGSIRRIHGAPADDYDRRIAQREVEKYCR